MKDRFQIERHPQWYYEPGKMEYLILGSFPPHPSRWSFPFYYPNKINYFWKILAAIAGRPLQYFTGEEAVSERKEIMNALGCGVQNMGKTICRRGNSAKDTDIVILEYHPVLRIIERHPELHTVILAGYSAAHSTYNSFMRYLKLNGIAASPPAKACAGAEFRILLGTREIRCVITNSTSPASFLKLGFLISQYSRIFKKESREAAQ
jgi:G:T/U-mismatch repair DNA glycosylase